MNISLTKELETLVSKKVSSGRYHSASEVVREGLRLLEEKDMLHHARLEQLKRNVQLGIDQLDRGQGTLYTEESLRDLFENVKTEGRKRLVEGKL